MIPGKHRFSLSRQKDFMKHQPGRDNPRSSYDSLPLKKKREKDRGFWWSAPHDTESIVLFLFCPVVPGMCR